MECVNHDCKSTIFYTEVRGGTHVAKRCEKCNWEQLDTPNPLGSAEPAGSGTGEEDNIFAPLLNCPHQDKEDGCCHHPGQPTPECHVFACPMLDPRIGQKFE